MGDGREGIAQEFSDGNEARCADEVIQGVNVRRHMLTAPVTRIAVGMPARGFVNICPDCGDRWYETEASPPRPPMPPLEIPVTTKGAKCPRLQRKKKKERSK